MGRLEWIISNHDKPEPHVVDFEEIYDLRDQINSITLLWDTNSYHVDLVRKEIIINGGRRICIKGFERMGDLTAIAVKRHTKRISFNGDEGDPGEMVSYLIGWEKDVEGEKKEIMLHISPDGREWCWRDHR